MTQPTGERIILSNLDPTMQEKILERSIILQGSEISLKELLLPPIEQVDLDYVIDSDILLKLYNNEKITVGKRLAPLNQTVEYIPRTINDIPEREILSDLQRSYNVVRSIVGATGSGKSTMLKNIARSIKRDRPYLWVLEIDLNEFQSSLKAFKENKLRPVTVLNLLNSKPDSKLNSFEKKIFTLHEKVVIMLDGVEEVHPDYKGVVSTLIEECIRRRPNAERAENYLFLTQLPYSEKFAFRSYSLRALTQENQIDIIKLWEQKVGKVFAEAVIKDIWFEGEDEVVGIPLKIQMLAELLEKRDNFDDGSEREVLPGKITLTELYQLYIHKNCSNGARTRLKSIGSDLAKINVECGGYLYVIALDSVLDKKRCHYFTCYKNKVPDEKLLTFGIIKKLDDELRFTHRSFAEYFVAECIANELRDFNDQLIKLFVNEVLIEDRFKVIRMFLNDLIPDLNSLPDEVFKAIGYMSNKFTLYSAVNEGLLSIIKLIFRSVDGVKAFPIDKTRNDKGRTLLHLAAKTGRLPVVKFLVESGASVTCKDGEGRSVLREAVENGCIETVKYLLERGADINSRCKYGCTALHCAARNGDLSLVKYLVENGAEINSRSNYRGMVLANAIESGNLEVVKYLVENGADFTFRNIVGGGTVLHIRPTSFDKATDIFKFFIEKGVDINDVDTDGRTVLHEAITWNSPLEFIEFLVDNGADIHIRTPVLWLNSISKTPLVNALSEKRLDILEYLVEKGARLYDCPRLNFFICRIVRARRLDIIKFLSKRGVSMNVKDDDGYSLIEMAVENNDVDMVKFLVETGVDDSGEALRLAVTTCGLDVVKTLVENGASTGLNFGEVNLYGDLDAVKYLIANGFTFDKVWDVGGNVELLRYLLDNDIKVDEVLVFHTAVTNGNLSVVKFLTERGFDGNYKDKGGCIPLHRAVIFNKLQILNYLLGHGAEPQIRCRKCEHTLLEEALYRIDLDSVKLLASRGPTPLTGSDLGKFLGKEAALAKVFEWGSLNMIEFIADKAFSCGVEEFMKILLANTDIQYLNARGFEIPSALVNSHRWLPYAAHSKDVGLVNFLNDLGVGDNGLTPQELKFIIDDCVNVNKFSDDIDVTLRNAVQYNFTKTISLFEAGAKVTLTEDGRSLLHEAIACFTSDLDTVKYLIDKGLDVNCKDVNGRTPLLEAVVYRYLDAVKLLMEKGAMLDGNDITPIVKLVHQDVVDTDVDIVKYLVKMGLSVNVKTKDGTTLLHVAALNRNTEGVKFLIRNGASVNAVDQSGTSALHNAVSNRSPVGLVKILIENGADVNVKDKDGHCALRKALSSEDVTLIKYLVEKGAVIGGKVGRTVLHDSAEIASIDIVKFFIQNGNDVNGTDEDGRTPLHEAATRCELNVVKLLVEHGADPNAKDKSGRNPLYNVLTAHRTNVSVLEYLVKSGADFSCRDNEGRTLLHVASAEGRGDAVEFLLELGVDINVKTMDGRTALHEAAKNLQVDVVELLVMKGAEVDAKADDGRTAFDEIFDNGEEWDERRDRIMPFLEST